MQTGEGGAQVARWDLSGITPKRSAELQTLQGLLRVQLERYINVMGIRHTDSLRPLTQVRYRADGLPDRIAACARRLAAVRGGPGIAGELERLERTTGRPFVSGPELSDAIAAGYRLVTRWVTGEAPVVSRSLPAWQTASGHWRRTVEERAELAAVRMFLDLMGGEGPKIGILGAWVHGSLATLDYVVGYSDFDTLLLLSRETCTDPDRLAQARSVLQRSVSLLFLFDPLQHHGHMVISECDLDHYQEAVFPLELFRHSVGVYSWIPAGTEVRCAEDLGERVRVFLVGVDLIRRWASGCGRGTSGHSLKAFLQMVVLLPALYLQLRDGVYRYKRDTFQFARPDFTEEEWRIIALVTRLRQEWRFRSLLPCGLRRWLARRGNGRALAALHRLESIRSLPAIRAVVGRHCAMDADRLASAMRSRLVRQGVL